MNSTSLFSLHLGYHQTAASFVAACTHTMKSLVRLPKQILTNEECSHRKRSEVWCQGPAAKLSLHHLIESLYIVFSIDKDEFLHSRKN